MTMEKLKPCPFCSGKILNRDSPFIICLDCGTTGRVESWNTRHMETALEARVKELEAELAQARADAVQWEEYDGNPATLP